MKHTGPGVISMVSLDVISKCYYNYVIDEYCIVNSFCSNNAFSQFPSFAVNAFPQLPSFAINAYLRSPHSHIYAFPRTSY